jgi:hypothetical protein
MISAIPVVLDALVALMRGQAGYRSPGKALTVSAIPVCDGMDLRDADARRALVIGSTVIADSSRVADSGVIYALDSTQETFDVLCSAMAWTGDGADEVSDLRAVVFAMVSDLDGALGLNRSLGGVAIDARVARVAYRVADRPSELLVAADVAVRVMV